MVTLVLDKTPLALGPSSSSNGYLLIVRNHADELFNVVSDLKILSLWYLFELCPNFKPFLP
jgi:hypothetical protein